MALAPTVGWLFVGRLQGAIASVMGIAGVIAPVLFTQVFAAAIGRVRGAGVPGAPFLLAALLLVAAMGGVRRAAAPPPRPPPRPGGGALAPTPQRLGRRSGPAPVPGFPAPQHRPLPPSHP